MNTWSEILTMQSPAYALMVGIGLVAAGAVYYLLPIDTPDKKGIVLFPAALGLMLGAKLPVVLSYGWGNPAAYAGKSLLGGLVGAYLAVRFAKRLYGIAWVGGGDAYVLPVAIATAVGRVGCLLNGCCGGRNGFPAPVLEIGFYLAMFALVLNWRRAHRFQGRWFPLYMLAYCIFRFFTEFIRTEPRIFAGFTAYQALALIGACIFAFELHHRSPRSGREAAHGRIPVE